MYNDLLMTARTGELFDSDVMRMVERINNRVGFQARKVERLNEDSWIVDRRSYSTCKPQSMVMDDRLIWIDLTYTGQVYGLW